MSKNELINLNYITNRIRVGVTIIKEQLNSMNVANQELALDLLDYFVDNSTISFHTQIGSKDFIGKLVNLLKSRDAPQIQIKILKLIKKWGKYFEKNADILPNFSITYQSMVNSGIDFPTDTK